MWYHGMHAYYHVLLYTMLLGNGMEYVSLVDTITTPSLGNASLRIIHHEVLLMGSHDVMEHQQQHTL